MKSKLVKIIGILFIAFFLFVPSLTIAQNDVFGVNDLNIVLEQDLNPKSVIVNIINIALGFLGLIAVIIIIYGGFVWMMSGGQSEKIDNAKKILKNGLIGLVIILLSWGIATYIFSKIIEIGGGGGTGSVDPGTSFNSGYGALGNCTLESVYPAPDQKEVARNTVIMLTFKEDLDSSSVCVDNGGTSCVCGEPACDNFINPDNFKIYPSTDNTQLLTEALASVSGDKKTIVIAPQKYLGSASGKTDYTVNVSGLIKEDGDPMFDTCANDFFQWQFEVSDKLDLEPPIIVSNGVFPIPDNLKDEENIINSVKATGEIKVVGCPNIYKEAEIISFSISSGANNIVNIIVNPNYSLDFTDLKVFVHSDGLQAQLQKIDGSLLGSAVINNNIINFPEYFSLEVEGYESGNSWEIKIKKRVLADNLVIGLQTYVFADNDDGNRIKVPAGACDVDGVAANINNKLSHPDLNSSVNNNLIILEAKVGGISANSIGFSSTNNSAFEFSPMAGGVDQATVYTTKDKPDQPMNSVIQINFNEAINPMTGVGSSDFVADHLRIINKGGAATGTACSSNKECLSYNCNDSSFCEGDYLSGEFRISNAYKTLEFVSDWECGVNGCGEKIFCLPAKSNLEVQIQAADLFNCGDCLTKQPFSICQMDGDLAYDTCQDSDGNNYPLADINNINGIVDTALNSLDANRNDYSEGPVEFFNQNLPDPNKGDNFKWSFWINDIINLEPPVIESLNPTLGDTDVDNNEPIKIAFNSLMQSSSLRTGSVLSNSIRHQYINLKSLSGAVGYWISSVNLDSDNNGQLDKTTTYINHTYLPASVSWRSQVGSGVKNIYQNCFKPSKGPNCVIDETNPSCCYGTATNTLINGSCP